MVEALDLGTFMIQTGMSHHRERKHECAAAILRIYVFKTGF